MSDNHYSVLGLKRNCTIEDINKAYRKNVKKWHPDRCSASNAATMFQRVEEAYQALVKSGRTDRDRGRTDVSNVKKRPGMTVVRFSSTNTGDVLEKISQYTQPGGSKHQAPKLRVRPSYKPKPTPEPEPKPKHVTEPKPEPKPKPIPKPEPKPIPGPEPEPKPIPKPKHVTEPEPEPKPKPKPIPKPVLKPEPKSEPNPEPEPEPEPDVESVDEGMEIPLNCTLEEVYTGKKRIIKTPQGKAVIVTIPQGCEQGDQIGVINPDTNSTDRFIVNIQKHSVFERKGTDLYMTRKVTLEEFINGFSVQVTLLNGRKKKISHKYSGTTVGPELEMKVKGMGMPIPASYPESYGKLVIRFKITLPESYPSDE